jgi:hypothetical protein
MFPSDWPPGCPPDDAVAPDCGVYRVVHTNPPTANDFRSLLELRRPIVNRLCESAGLSVFTELRDAVHCAEKYPHLGELIAAAHLQPRHGKLKPTPRRGNSHTTWWPSRDLDRHGDFSVVSY